jgi:predicted TIM-barrel fold metal-dependent hydrolase
MTTRTCAPPLPHPTKPKYAPPPLACDAHCHVFGPPERFPYAPDRPYTPAESAPQERLARLHAHLGFARAVIVQATPHGADNRAVLDAIAAGGGARRGVALVGEAVTDAELERLDAGGVRGVRFNFVRHLGGAPDPAVFDRIVRQVQGLGWHVELHFDAEDIAAHRELLGRMPVPYVIDHMGRVKADGGLGQPALKALLELLRDERAWVKVSGAERVSASGRRPFHDAIPIARAIIEAAPDRVLWGTDWPHPNVPHDMPDDGELVDLFAAVCADEGLRRKVLVDNPARLYWPEAT